MIKYNKDLDFKNKSKFCIGVLFNPVTSSEPIFNCVICESDVSLHDSVSREGAHLVCCECQYNKFNNYDELVQFLEANDD